MLRTMYVGSVPASSFVRGRLRLSAPVCFVVTVCGCATYDSSGAVKKEAQIATATESHCDRPGVRLDSVRRVGAAKPLVRRDQFSSVSVEPGRYKVAVACQNPLNETKSACMFWGHPSEYPTYNLKLRPGIRYTFHCYESHGDLLYRISESDL